MFSAKFCMLQHVFAKKVNKQQNRDRREERLSMAPDPTEANTEFEIIEEKLKRKGTAESQRESKKYTQSFHKKNKRS